MAPTFAHGKGTRLLVGRYDLSPFVMDSTISASCDPPETTTYQQNDRAYIPGLRDATASFSGLFDADSGTSSTAITDILTAALGGSTKLVTTLGMEGDTLGNHAQLLNGDETMLDVHAPYDGAVETNFDVQASGGYRGGVFLRALSAATSTGSGTAVTCPGTTSVGGTTGGGFAHFHITSASTLTSVTLKVQHSTSGSTWADLASFTSTAEGFQRTEVTGTVKEQLRSTISAFTGGAGKTITASVAFARGGKIVG